MLYNLHIEVAPQAAPDEIASALRLAAAEAAQRIETLGRRMKVDEAIWVSESVQGLACGMEASVDRSD